MAALFGIVLVCEVSSAMLLHTRFTSVRMSAQHRPQFWFGSICFGCFHDTLWGLLGYNISGWASSATFENISCQRKTDTSDFKESKAHEHIWKMVQRGQCHVRQIWDWGIKSITARSRTSSYINWYTYWLSKDLSLLWVNIHVALTWAFPIWVLFLLSGN